MRPVVAGRYEVLEKLREGGMGAIYRARDLERDEPRVLKVMKAAIGEDAHARERFQREAEMARRLAHPNVAAFHELAEAALSATTGAASGRNSRTAAAAALAASAVRTIGRCHRATRCAPAAATGFGAATAEACPSGHCASAPAATPGWAIGLTPVESSMAALTRAAKPVVAMRPPGARNVSPISA